MTRLFGTDGIRGTAGEYPLDEPTAKAIGTALAREMSDRLGRPAKFVCGRDTRESGTMLERAIRAGIASEGGECRSAGVITTPGVAYVTKSFGFDAGIVISASHNPFEDNGIKIFLPNGMKLDEAAEKRIESSIAEGIDHVSSIDSEPSAAEDAFHRAYLDHLNDASARISANSYRIVIDCANGAASGYAKDVFRNFAGGVVIINDRPDGRNINHGCGSLHLEGLRERVKAESATMGIAFDGDADRALFIDENGEVVDGDATLWIMANHLKSSGKLANSTVVATVMSNIGLELALSSEGIRLVRTSVGDKYVLDKLIETGSEVGGEQSGHIIFPERSLVGDGMMTALLLLEAVSNRGTTLSDAASGFTAYPQVLLNVRVDRKLPFEEVPEIAAEARRVEGELEGSGRLLLRYSGTENLARVMIEGKDQKSIEHQADCLARAIQNALG